MTADEKIDHQGWCVFELVHALADEDKMSTLIPRLKSLGENTP